MALGGVLSACRLKPPREKGRGNSSYVCSTLKELIQEPNTLSGRARCRLIHHKQPVFIEPALRDTGFCFHIQEFKAHHDRQ